MNFAADNYGWARDEILDSPVLFLLLMMNEFVRKASGGKGISLMDLEDMEASEGLSWEEQVRRNHEQLRQSGLLSI